VLAVSQLGLCSTYRGAGRLARCLRGRPGEDLAAPGTMPVLPIRYRGRCDVLALDG
jgi:hypothetical protein